MSCIKYDSPQPWQDAVSPRDECSEYFQVMIKWIYLS